MSSSRKKRRREKGVSTTSVLSFEDDEDHADGEIVETFKKKVLPSNVRFAKKPDEKKKSSRDKKSRDRDKKSRDKKKSRDRDRRKPRSRGSGRASASPEPSAYMRMAGGSYSRQHIDDLKRSTKFRGRLNRDGAQDRVIVHHHLRGDSANDADLPSVQVGVASGLEDGDDDVQTLRHTIDMSKDGGGEEDRRAGVGSRGAMGFPSATEVAKARLRRDRIRNRTDGLFSPLTLDQERAPLEFGVQSTDPRSATAGESSATSADATKQLLRTAPTKRGESTMIRDDDHDLLEDVVFNDEDSRGNALAFGDPGRTSARADMARNAFLTDRDGFTSGGRRVKGPKKKRSGRSRKSAVVVDEDSDDEDLMEETEEQRHDRLEREKFEVSQLRKISGIAVPEGLLRKGPQRRSTSPEAREISDGKSSTDKALEAQWNILPEKPSTLAQIRRKLTSSVHTMEEGHEKTQRESRQMAEESTAKMAEREQFETKLKKLDEKFKFFQSMRGHIRSVCACLTVKTPEIEKAADDLLELQKEHARKRQRATNTQIQEDYEEAFGVLGANASNAQSQTMSFSESGRKLAREQCRLKVFERRARRKAERDARWKALISQRRKNGHSDDDDSEKSAAQRQQEIDDRRTPGSGKKRKRPSDDGANDKPRAPAPPPPPPVVQRTPEFYDGWSTDEDSDAEEEFQRSRSTLIEVAHSLLDDVNDEIRSYDHLLSVVAECRKRFPKAYKAAWVADSLPSLLAPYIGMELFEWDPLTKPNFDTPPWYQKMLDYSTPQHEEDGDAGGEDDDDADGELVPRIVHSVVFPHVGECVEFGWDPFSEKATNAALKVVGEEAVMYVAEDDPAIKDLLDLVLDRLQSSANMHFRSPIETSANAVAPTEQQAKKIREFVPLVPRAGEVNTSGPEWLVCTRRWWRGLKLLKNLLAWLDVLPARAVQDLAFSHTEDSLLPLLRVKMTIPKSHPQRIYSTDDIASTLDMCRCLLEMFPREWVDKSVHTVLRQLSHLMERYYTLMLPFANRQRTIEELKMLEQIKELSVFSAGKM